MYPFQSLSDRLFYYIKSVKKILLPALRSAGSIILFKKGRAHVYIFFQSHLINLDPKTHFKTLSNLTSRNLFQLQIHYTLEAITENVSFPVYQFDFFFVYFHNSLIPSVKFLFLPQKSK